jgi:hypothetical protein
VSFELGRALLSTEAVSSDVLADAFLTSTREGVSLVRALLMTKAIAPERLEQEFGRGGSSALTAVVPAPELVAALPHDLCARLLVAPLRRDPETGVVEVCVPDLRDAHGAAEIGRILGAEVRLVRARVDALVRAVLPVSQRVRAPAETGAADDEETGPGTLIPPAHAVPPPPNTERRPPVFVSSIPAGAASQPPNTQQRLHEALRVAKDRDAVLDLLLSGTREIAPKSALFIVRKDEFVGWGCTPEFGDLVALRTVVLRSDAPSVLATAAAAGSYVGPLPRTQTHSVLLRAMGSVTREIAVQAVRVFGRSAILILADDLGDALSAKRRIEELANAAGLALSRILRERK